ncbi:winged helix DNA-binding protein [uncultured Erythrobacter sp.]|uniref:winged helix DNA-binding protein n=1 Tax=uncultured Erythrobacter sp. TaxID=263913 RepID=UPI00262B152E|nr:winged helix DNA-binding protein [uncultured Erythrobacter sp.]
MNEIKDGEKMPVDLAQSNPHSNASNKIDLGALAKHLAVIADTLRETTGRPTNADSTSFSKASADANGSSDIASGILANYPIVHAGANTQPVHSDILMRRLQFAALAREAYAIRRRRTVIFDNAELFGEPAWDILLDLYIAQAERKKVSVSSACIGSAAPPTTGLRWLGVLSEQGLVLREHDPEDQRRVLVRLTEKGLASMDDYFANASSKF